MDARTTGSSIEQQPPSLRRWLAKERENGRFYRVSELVAAFVLVAMLAISFTVLRGGDPGSTLKPPVIALLLVANLIPAIVLMVLFSRRLALRRAEQGGLGTGMLHTRLVAIFSVIAAVPTVLVAIFASLLFQAGLEFWFSDKARGMLENSVQLARGTYQREVQTVAGETTTMAEDLVAKYLPVLSITDARFGDAFARYQVLPRELSEATIFTAGSDGVIRTLVLVNPYDRPLERVVTAAKLAELKGKPWVEVSSPDRVGVLTRLNYGPDTYLYAARVFDPEFREQMGRADDVLSDYQELLARSRINQLRFNAALLLGSLVIVGLSILGALKLADRLVRPMGALVDAAGRVEEGDFTARVPIQKSDDEIGVLAAAFNRMTGRLEEQTGALKAVNTQLDTRRAFIEAVLGSVTAGVIALDTDRRILLINRSASTLLQHGEQTAEGRTLGALSAELEEFLCGDQRNADVLVRSEHGQRTLAVNRVRYSDGYVLTFDDITDQLADQRRAAWSDIARRIAHEIKNPLTPIQLAAERLQRRYGKEVQTDPETFGRLTETIVRQVGDLRRMVDEFSNFARMPKPVFRDENVHDIARTSLFLHEVAHPGISFALNPPAGDIRMICDRRQLSQALTNVVKNAVEAIEARRNRGEHSLEGDRVALAIRDSEDSLVLDLTDTGIGLPEERERLTEPYMTTRVRGTGLGLAIVKKIVEEHGGEIAFLDRAGGGTHVRIAFDKHRLALLAEAARTTEETGEDGVAASAHQRRATDPLRDDEEPK
ncbi:ATP-binding protein [Sphingomonas sp. BN140010]|uniref:histidine kinase n=1 Tax=Sphingomonas arvum TaxID=2992113 RepID=A0ABT3JEJ3_9SPHN|nr:ATP-binding protein [Sphingomonas sp. BN140010]MCW3797496.1 ATP-binding protein [Sphingomonas sp. BN140010]